MNKMQNPKAPKAINFDLDINALKAHYCQETGQHYTQAYADIRKFMENNDFTHRQGSGYISSRPMTNTEISHLAARMRQQFPWLRECVKEIDVTNIVEQHSLIPEFYKDQNLTKDQIMDQYTAGISCDDARIVDYETMWRDHPELAPHNNTQQQDKDDHKDISHDEHIVAKEDADLDREPD